MTKLKSILTFATDFLIDYLSDAYEASPGIVRAGIEVERILSKIDKSRPERRRLIQFDLHKQIQEDDWREVLHALLHPLDRSQPRPVACSISPDITAPAM